MRDISFYDRRRGTEQRLRQIAVAIERRILPDRRSGKERRSWEERRHESRIDILHDRRTIIFEY